MKLALDYARHRSRRGTLLLSVLACLTICAMLLTYWLRLIAIERRQVRGFQAAMQAELAADAALVRGKHRLHANPQYTGEIWRPSIDALSSAEVTISVLTRDNESDRQLQVTAQIGSGSNPVARRTRSQSMPISAEEAAP